MSSASNYPRRRDQGLDVATHAVVKVVAGVGDLD